MTLSVTGKEGGAEISVFVSGYMDVEEEPEDDFDYGSSDGTISFCCTSTNIRMQRRVSTILPTLEAFMEVRTKKQTRMQ